MEPKPIAGIPQQRKGGFHDTESQKKFESSEITIKQFEMVKKRFFEINRWIEYCGKGFAEFKLFNTEGEFIERAPETGDYIRIDIPGPGNFEAQGFDWVQIIAIEQNADAGALESYHMICRPSQPPYDKKNSHTAHFYSEESTSSFIISRSEKSIKTGVYGRNEYPNMNAGFLDKIRNLLIGIGGMIGLSKIQWKKLTNGLLDPS